MDVINNLKIGKKQLTHYFLYGWAEIRLCVEIRFTVEVGFRLRGLGL